MTTALTPDEVEQLLDLVDLARTGDTSRLEAAIDAGVPVNLTNGAGDSLLILSAYHCHADTVEMLLSRGADHSRVNDRGQTALAAAVFRRRTSIVAALLAAGADPCVGAQSAVAIATYFELTEFTAMLTAQQSRPVQKI